MPWYPGAIRKPITVAKGRDRLTVWNRMNLHVAVSEASTLHHVFNVGGQVDSHFYVRRDGTIEQYVDTAWQAFADLDGNDATISVETQGMGGGGWTPEQRESLARLYAWAVKTHGIARKMATSSKIGNESKGLSWHRLGCDGNFPPLPSILAGRNQRGGGMRYTKHFGKVCPGDGRVVQIPGIYARAMVILDGAPPEKEEGFLMALDDKQQKEMYDRATDKVHDPATGTWDSQADAMRKTNILLRRVLARQLTDQVAPVDVDVNADDVADALVERLPESIAQAVADALAARLAK